MTTYNENGNYNYENDPFAEPEDVGFFIIPEGTHETKVKEAIFTSDPDSGILKKIQMVFEFDQFKEKTDYPWINIWFHPSNSFGRHLLTAALENLGVPYDVPDADTLRKDTGAPRKTFAKAMKDEITGQWTDAGLRGKQALVQVHHKWKCPACNVTNPMKETNCKGKKGAPCGHEYEKSTCKIFPQIDFQAIYPLTEEQKRMLHEANVMEAV